MSRYFDVFLSHNRRDKATVKRLAEALRQRDLRVWLDDWELVPGRPWQEALEEIIETTRAAAVLVGSDGLGPWEEQEMRACISEFVDRKLPVIPVLLPGAPRKPKLPLFLKQFTWVDLREGITEEGLDGLVWGITGEKPTGTTVPRYPDEHVRGLSQELEKAHRQKETLVIAGRETTVIDGEILALRRRIREGGQLKAGDFLDDGRFKLIEQIGRGGFATVWKAYDRRANELVAVKVLHGQFAEDRTRRERFFRGARKMAQLQHQGIVRVIEAKGEDGGYWFFVMEHVGGGDLRQAVLEGRLTLEERLRIIREVGEVLELAHLSGVIHRDVKPANILLDDSGRPKLTDFDLVRALDTTGGTRTEGMLGTFLYAAPEAMHNPKETEATADVYSLGMATVFAIYGKELPIMVMRDAESIISNLSCSPGVKEVLGKAVDWDPGRRFSSVATFCHELNEPVHDSFFVEETDANGIVFVRIPPGTFTMGSAEGDPLARDAKKPAHQVTLSEFWISKYPITNEQYRRVRPDHQESKVEAGDLPVTWIRRYDARKFCEQLGYRLPTEAEWEYAARAGTETPWSFGADDSEIGRYAWYEANSEDRVHPVGTREPNPWGLYDMHGNVWEWVDDEYQAYSAEPQTNPATPRDSWSSAVALVRGGSYRDRSGGLRSAYRGRFVSEVRNRYLGFRCVRGPRRQP